jgi:hypothetical protein
MIGIIDYFQSVSVIKNIPNALTRAQNARIGSGKNHVRARRKEGAPPSKMFLPVY